jgi:hypothetical protein
MFVLPYTDSLLPFMSTLKGYELFNPPNYVVISLGRKNGKVIRSFD